jgi:hypothetical protein
MKDDKFRGKGINVVYKVHKPHRQVKKWLPNKNKLKYLSFEPIGHKSPSSRNRKHMEQHLETNKNALQKIKSTVGDEFECWNFDIENIETIDKVSQYSMLISTNSNWEHNFSERVHSNSVNHQASDKDLKFEKNETYDARGMGLTMIPSSLLNSSRLTKIILSNNQITELPEKLCELRFLKCLSVDNNLLRKLPSSIGNLKYLKGIDFQNNRIEEIPKEIGNCSELRKIRAKNNYFSAIPSSLCKLEYLSQFDIEWFKYCFPPIKIAFSKEDKALKDQSNKSSSASIIARFKELWKMFEKYGTFTLNVFITYFSNDFDHTKGESPDFNKQDNRRRTILHRAATDGHVGVVKGLISIEDINPNLLEKDQWTPLGLALRDEREEVAKILLEKDKVDVNAGFGSFGAPIHIAVSKNKINIIEKLIKRKVDVNKLDYKHQTPLHIIMDVYSRDTELAEKITKILVFNGAKLNLLDSDKLSPLHRAVIKKHSLAIKLIWDLNKKLEVRKKEVFDINLIGGEKKYTPIYYALEKKWTKISELLFLNGAKVCIRVEREYLPREWNKRENNVRKHVLWKMERLWYEKRFQRIKYYAHDLNHPEVIKKIEGYDNCLDGYTTMGSYLKKYRQNKLKLLKNRRQQNEEAGQKNSCQKILFTINNPDTKVGDIEVEEIDFDEDAEEEEKEEICDVGSFRKKNMNSLNKNEAFLIPKSLKVNNKDHFKGPNIFLLRDKIWGKSVDSLKGWLMAVNILARTDVDKKNKVNFKTVLKELAINLDKIKYQSVLIQVIELIQFKGDNSLVEELKKHVIKQVKMKSEQEAYHEFGNACLLSRQISQNLLNVWIAKLTQEGLLFPVLKERRPYKQLIAPNRELLKPHTRSVNRVDPFKNMISKSDSEDKDKSINYSSRKVQKKTNRLENKKSR